MLLTDILFSRYLSVVWGKIPRTVDGSTLVANGRPPDGWSEVRTSWVRGYYSQWGYLEIFCVVLTADRVLIIRDVIFSFSFSFKLFNSSLFLSIPPSLQFYIIYGEFYLLYLIVVGRYWGGRWEDRFIRLSSLTLLDYDGHGPAVDSDRARLGTWVFLTTWMVFNLIYILFLYRRCVWRTMENYLCCIV